MELNEKNFLSVEELSEYLSASLSTVYKLAQQGEIPAQKMGRQWRFSREKIDSWIAEGRGGLYGPAGLSGAAPSGATATPAAKRESNAAKIRALSAIFTDEQMKTLRSFSLDSAQRLLTTLATSTGRKGLEKLLELKPKELDEIATKLVEQI